ncbi:unnamed protein product, partial [Amoebophrya sp. A120]
ALLRTPAFVNRRINYFIQRGGYVSHRLLQIEGDRNSCDTLELLEDAVLLKENLSLNTTG